MPQTKTTWTGLSAYLLGRVLTRERRKKRDQALLHRVLEGFSKGETLLDYGAGSGFLAIEVAKQKRGGKVIALDASPVMLDQLRRRARELGLQDQIEILCADATDTGMPDGSIDRLVTSKVLHEIPDKQAALDEISRILKPGGKLVVKDVRSSTVGKLMTLVFHRDINAALNPDTLRVMLQKRNIDVDFVQTSRIGMLLVAYKQNG